MMDQTLRITVECEGAHECRFRGKDVFFDIGIANLHQTAVGFPLEFVQKTGPIVRLVDARTGAESYVKKNLADPALQEAFTVIPPGQSVKLAYVITGAEVRQFGGPPVDVSAEVTVMATIQVDGKRVEFRGGDVLRIVGDGKAH